MRRAVTVMAALAFGLGGMAVAVPAAADTCNKDNHAGGPYMTGGLMGEVTSGFATELGGIGQFTGPGNSGASAECRDAKRG